MGTARFTRIACRFADSRVNGHSSISSMCLWIGTFEGQWVQLTLLAVFVDMQILGLVSTARLARCACAFADLRVDVLVDFHCACGFPLCLWISTFEGQ